MRNIVVTLSRVIRLMFAYYRGARVKGWTLAGVDTEIEWDGDGGYRYMSYAEDPYNKGEYDGLYFDDFGVEDSDVFYYLDGFWETVRFMLAPAPDGWQIKRAYLLFINN